MNPRCAAHTFLRLAAGGLALAAMRALAADQALLSKEMSVDPGKEIGEVRIFEDVVVAPIPISNPTIGTGLAVVVMPFYHLGAGSPLSNTAVAAGVTSSGSWGVGAAQSTRLRGDQLRVDGFLGYIDLRYRFYGAGASAGSAGVSVPLVQKALAFAPELLFHAGRRTFLGLRYRGVRVETAIESSTAPPPIEALIGGSLTIFTSGLGPKLTYDTRDHEMSPSSGVFVELRTNFAREDFGSDFNYDTYELGGNYYRRIGTGVVGLRGY